MLTFADLPGAGPCFPRSDTGGDRVAASRQREAVDLQEADPSTPADFEEMYSDVRICTVLFTMAAERGRESDSVLSTNVRLGSHWAAFVHACPGQPRGSMAPQQTPPDRHRGPDPGGTGDGGKSGVVP